MAYLREAALFFTTSPRTPSKMIPEIRLLAEESTGRPWDRTTQAEFMRRLADAPFFEGNGSPSDPAFSARDRINRAPKALGFVDLDERIALTPAGRELVYGKRPQEVFLRQILKFQLPSPYHRTTPATKDVFCVRPYLEILRLVRDLGHLTFDECKIFAFRLTDYHLYESIADTIRRFRSDIERHRGSYKRFVDETWTRTILEIYADGIAQGRTRTRETRDAGLGTFLKTKKSNFRDYTDACFRYLRYTELLSLSQKSRSISVFPGREREVDHILATVPRGPVFTEDGDGYRAYLFDPTTPILYADRRDELIGLILRSSPDMRQDLGAYTVDELKDLRDEISRRQRTGAVEEQTAFLKTYGPYPDVIDTYRQIRRRGYYDAPLMMEYNTWRAMTMLDGGEIRGNFRFDDAGGPLSTAPGNMPDIECDYGDFAVCVEVTLQSGQRQYESEGEPVARHFGQFRKKLGKDTYCLFIAPVVNDATLAHFYTLNRYRTAYYGGKTNIIPLSLDQFVQLMGISRDRGARPSPADIRRFLDHVMEGCGYAVDELDWKERIQSCVDHWLSA